LGNLVGHHIKSHWKIWQDITINPLRKSWRTMIIYLLATRTIANLSRCKVHFRRDTQLFPDANGRKHLMLWRKGLNVRLFPTLHKSKVVEPVVPFLPHFRKLFIYNCKFIYLLVLHVYQFEWIYKTFAILIYTFLRCIHKTTKI
jgi:hypothetical protein